MRMKDFGKISVQDIAELATLNRATFYDHYPDKYTLLECMVGSRFDELLTERRVRFDGTCAYALKAIVLALCDYLAATPRMNCEQQSPIEPHLESAVIAVIRKMMLHGLKDHPPQGPASTEMIATTASWAIYGAVKEWLQTPNRCPSDEIADIVMMLVVPILGHSIKPG